MGTRGALGFIKNGITKVTYNHGDSYPSWLGKNTCKFVAKHRHDLDRIAERIVLVSENVPPTEEQLVHCKNFKITDTFVGGPSDHITWYQALRGSQGDLRYYANNLDYMKDDINFLNDSLSCEYAYIINLDTNKLEFYEGFNKDRKAAGRYADCESLDYCEEYHGVALVGEIELDKISAESFDFIKDVEVSIYKQEVE
jgi:hypothetical protein